MGCCWCDYSCGYYLLFLIKMHLKAIIKKNQIDLFLFLITASLYFLNNFVFKEKSNGIAHYFFVCYFNDLICPLGFLAYVNILLFFINKKIEKLYGILIFCFICGTVWEFVAPLLKESSVTDFYDILCYCIGGLMYWTIKRIFLRVRELN